jgi:hypothetical protein
MLPASGRSGKPAALPGRKPAWSTSTKAWWRTLWSSPMAPLYLDADRGPLERLAELVEQHARGELSATGLIAMQQLEDRFGLSPLARQRLWWQVVGDPIPLLSERPRSAGSSVRRLRAIDPERGDGE